MPHGRRDGGHCVWAINTPWCSNALMQFGDPLLPLASIAILMLS